MLFYPPHTMFGTEIYVLYNIKQTKETNYKVILFNFKFFM